MTIERTAFHGLCLVHGFHHQDSRGSFGKLFRADWFRSEELFFDIREQFFSVSARDVIRGLHFQRPPHDHAKLVFCLRGEVMDVAVDLRAGSGTYGEVFSRALTEANHLGVFIPRGFAHGFRAMTDDALVLYNTDAEHAPESDAGILWSSIEFDWATRNPVVSERDAAFPTLAEFETPF